MPRKRSKQEDAWLPPRVYRGRSAYEFHPKSGENIRLISLPKGPETELVKASVWEAYRKALTAPVRADDMNRLIEAFHKSAQFCQLSVNTQKDYLQYSKRISRVFGHMLPSAITPPHIRKFMDAMAEKGVIVQANRHHSYLSVLFGWGIERAWCQSNPAKQVRKFREEPRDRYIEDWEYDLVLNVARSSSYPYLAPMMELSYLCRARSIEVRAFTEKHITDEGILLIRTKGSLGEVTGWSDRMRKTIKEARSLFPGAPVSTNRPLIHDKSGHAIATEAFKSAWGRVMNKALEQGLKERFTFHDIKAKGVTDHESHASGHKSKKMLKVYNRKPDIVEPTR
jgi:site-specific recombinase XerC